MSRHTRFGRLRRNAAATSSEPQVSSEARAHRRPRHGDEFGPRWSGGSSRFARDDAANGEPDPDRRGADRADGPYFGRRRGPRPGPGGWAGPWGPGGAGGPGFPGGRGGRGMGRPGGPRRNRGDVRAAILWLLAERPMHGYELITEVESASGGAWRPSPGAIYPTLSMLADEGLVTIAGPDDDASDGGRANAGGRKVFALTDAGSEQASKLRAGTPPWGEAGPADNLGESAKALGAAVWQIARAGTADERAAARVVIDQARRELYRILAGDAPAATASESPNGE